MSAARPGTLAGLAFAALIACSAPRETAPAAISEGQAPADSQHAGLTEPHGDHSPHHGGIVLMNGDLHYEVVFDRADGKHQVWFSSATREELPASVATDVVMVVTPKGAPPERLALQIDDAGEAWVANGRPVTAAEVMVKLTYAVRGTPHEIEIPVS